MIKKLANVITLVMALTALAGCGGGGGETSGYSGKTAPTALTVGNATVMSLDVVDGLDSVSALGGIAKRAASSPEDSIRIRSLSDALEKSVAAMAQKPALAKTVAEATSGTQYGYSGSFTYAGTLDTTTGKIVATFTYNAYQASADSVIISGSVSVSGTVLALRGGGVQQLNIVISSLQIAEPGGRYGSDAGVLVTVKGRMSIVNDVDKTITLSMVFTDGASGKTYWYKDFSTVVSYSTTTIQGTFYHPDYGYVTLTTLTPLSNATNTYGDPVSGQLLFTGGNGSQVRLTYTGTGVGYLLELDATGTGIYTAL
ncbi:hypothetical protein KOM00_12655 [Geomonas sp. Red69]|uniref:Lipoprotein n=1 Tax=Geomonas diazotrophica TaxID=2843197 RepID=A0ABX8JV58_9BACT|nr:MULTISPECIES: hypothetical protein [Geomonas]MBU5637579.1 hypothetical protein [Geomonas diazotrophica]QWV99300.1 hypothetical protein KP005_08510 [Geomonas nitrogeniifigens]QXE88467.1 hypothetical protein KP003_08760 [Geomonas nitrogeniifigens]